MRRLQGRALQQQMLRAYPPAKAPDLDLEGLYRTVAWTLHGHPVDRRQVVMALRRIMRDHIAAMPSVPDIEMRLTRLIRHYVIPAIMPAEYVPGTLEYWG